MLKIHPFCFILFLLSFYQALLKPDIASNSVGKAAMCPMGTRCWCWWSVGQANTVYAWLEV